MIEHHSHQVVKNLKVTKKKSLKQHSILTGMKNNSKTNVINEDDFVEELKNTQKANKYCQRHCSKLPP